MKKQCSDKSRSQVQEACKTLGYEIDAEHIDAIAKKLDELRDSRHGCLQTGGGIVPFVKIRLHDMKLLPCHCGQDSDEFFLVGLFHFFKSSESVVRWKDPGFKAEEQSASIKRSPLSRITEASPINATARKIAGNGDKPCPYCKRYFRNPAAMAMHIQENHL
jgi:hypothetical protein